MVVFGVRDRETGKTVEFPSNPTELYPSKKDAEKALANKNNKVKEGETKIDGEVVAFTLQEPVLAGVR